MAAALQRQRIGHPDGTDSPLFSYLNAGKRSITWPGADLSAEIAGADIIVVTATRSQAAQWGIEPERLLAEFPRAVIVTISDFGWTGPYADRAASEFTLQAWSGLTGFRGDPAGPPIAVGGDLGEYMGGVFAAFGALAVRRRVEHGGPGEHLDLSMLEAITLMQSGEWLHSHLLQTPPVTRTVEVPSIEPAKDGYIGITMVTGQQWLDFAAMVDCPELTENPQLSFQIGRWQYRDFIREQIRPWLAERTVAEVVELGQLFRLPIAALGNGATIRDTDYVRERGVFVRNPAGFHQPRTPWLMSRCAPGVAAGCARARRGRRHHAVAYPRISRAALGSAAAVRRHPHRRPDRVLGRTRGDAPARGVRRRRRQSGVDPTARRHQVLRRHAKRPRRLVGIRLGVPRHEHQQAFCHTGFGF